MQWNRSAQPAAPAHRRPFRLPPRRVQRTALLTPRVRIDHHAGPLAWCGKHGRQQSECGRGARGCHVRSVLAVSLPDATAAPGAGALPTTPGIDPVTGLVRRPAAPPESAGPEVSTALASLDRSKVMSFQFRNAPWTVVLSQFAAETHLELRMEKLPQGVFNRWDVMRISPSQTLSILNSEIARVGCQLKLDGNILRVVDLSPSTPQNAPAATPGKHVAPVAVAAVLRHRPGFGTLLSRTRNRSTPTRPGQYAPAFLLAR